MFTFAFGKTGSIVRNGVLPLICVCHPEVPASGFFTFYFLIFTFYLHAFRFQEKNI